MKFGVTERGDAGLDFSWTNRLLPGNVIISKNLNDKLIEELVKYKDKIIFHMTCTGYGGTVVEPNVPNYMWTYEQMKKLIAAGFPLRQIVLRVDPIIPTQKGLETAAKVLDQFIDLGITRMRYSVIDMHPHILKRFKQAGLPLPYVTYMAPAKMMKETRELVRIFENAYDIESCAEETDCRIGCVSKKDFDILGLKFEEEKILPHISFRPACDCYSGKTELLKHPYRCAHQCLYCYWIDKEETGMTLEWKI